MDQPERGLRTMYSAYSLANSANSVDWRDDASRVEILQPQRSIPNFEMETMDKPLNPAFKGVRLELSSMDAATQTDFTRPQSFIRQSIIRDAEKSTIEQPLKGPSVNDAIPNGGKLAWMQVVGAFFLFFNSWGLINTFGTYQTYYETTLLTSSSASDLSWIGSVQAFCLIFIGPLTGPIYDAGYSRALIFTGTFLVVFGHMMLSLCNAYYQVLLAQAFCVGIGAGCLFIPSVAILATYFNTKLATAMGIAASGSSLGGVIYPITLYKLLPQVGFAWATRILGFIALATLLVSNIVMKVRVLPAAKRKVFDFPAFKEPPYTFFVAGTTFAWMGLFAVFFYVEFFSISNHIADESLSFYTLAMINAASTFGRVVPNILADKFGPMNIIVPAAVISGVLMLCLIGVHTVGGLVVICLLYGFFSGALVSLPATIYVHLSAKQRGLIGTRMGMGFGVNSLGLLLGAPICGWILGGSSFTFVWVFGAVVLIFGASLIAVSRMFKVGRLTLMAKA